MVAVPLSVASSPSAVCAENLNTDKSVEPVARLGLLAPVTLLGANCGAMASTAYCARERPDASFVATLAIYVGPKEHDRVECQKHNKTMGRDRGPAHLVDEVGHVGPADLGDGGPNADFIGVENGPGGLFDRVVVEPLSWRMIRSACGRPMEGNSSRDRRTCICLEFGIPLL